MPVVLNKLLGKERAPFLVLSEEATAPVDIAPVRSVEPEVEPSEAVVASLQFPFLQTPAAVPPAPAASTETAAEKVAPAAGGRAPVAAESAPTSVERVLTTAELLAAERAKEVTPPREILKVTFAAELLNPSQALPRGRRRPGAALASFKQMADGLKSSLSAGRGDAARG